MHQQLANVQLLYNLILRANLLSVISYKQITTQALSLYLHQNSYCTSRKFRSFSIQHQHHFCREEKKTCPPTDSSGPEPCGMMLGAAANAKWMNGGVYSGQFSMNCNRFDFQSTAWRPRQCGSLYPHELCQLSVMSGRSWRLYCFPILSPWFAVWARGIGWLWAPCWFIILWFDGFMSTFNCCCCSWTPIHPSLWW